MIHWHLIDFRSEYFSKKQEQPKPLNKFIILKVNLAVNSKYSYHFKICDSQHFIDLNLCSIPTCFPPPLMLYYSQKG